MDPRSLTATVFIALLGIPALAAEEAFRPLRGPYMGQEADDAPAIFLPGKISTDSDETCGVFFPGARSFLWRSARYGDARLLLLEERDGRWQPPREVDLVPGDDDVWNFALSADGRSLYFSTSAPVEGAAGTNLWVVELDRGGWGEAEPLGPSVNTRSDETSPSVDGNGVLYFAREGLSFEHAGDLAGDIYRARPREGGFARARPLPAPVSSASPDSDPFIAADGSYLIFSSRRPGGLGLGDLYVSFRGEGDSWGEAINLGPRINSPADEKYPSVTLDGEYFFFVSNREPQVRLPPGVPPASSMPGRGSFDIYWMKADFLFGLRRRAVSPDPGD